MKVVKAKNITRENRPRNVLHDHPLMKKGGVHVKTEKAQRQREKMKLKKLWSCLKSISIQ